jgi:CDGSH-type Zn-finger protein
MADVTITVRDNGPLLVSGPVQVKDAEGNVFDLQGKETFALCRCGQTKNRPFCDGQHKVIGFQGCERAKRVLDE